MLRVGFELRLVCVRGVMGCEKRTKRGVKYIVVEGVIFSSQKEYII